MILVCGGIADGVTELVCARLQDCGFPYRLLDLGHYPVGYRVKWHWQDSSPKGYIESTEWKIDLDELTGVYVRYLEPDARLPLPDVPLGHQSVIHAENDTGLMLLLDDLPCAVVNRSGGSMSNHSKPYQALLIKQCGLLTPPTLITNDPEAAQRFYDACDGDVIYKSLSGIRSIVRRVAPDQLARLPLLQNGPAQFQLFISGENVRVHTVGERVFATRVRSEAVDYRYAVREALPVSMEPIQLPPSIAEACLRLAQRLDLLLTGIDLKVTPNGDYYCFEVNPSPGFLYYERYTGQPISTALAELLQHGAS